MKAMTIVLCILGSTLGLLIFQHEIVNFMKNIMITLSLGAVSLVVLSILAAHWKSSN